MANHTIPRPFRARTLCYLVALALLSAIATPVMGVDIPSLAGATLVEVPDAVLPPNMIAVVVSANPADPDLVKASLGQEVQVGVYLRRPTLPVARLQWRLRYDPSAVAPVLQGVAPWQSVAMVPPDVEGAKVAAQDGGWLDADKGLRVVAGSTSFWSLQGDGCSLGKVRFRATRTGLTNFRLVGLVPDGQPPWLYRTSVDYACELEVLP